MSAWLLHSTTNKLQNYLFDINLKTKHDFEDDNLHSVYHHSAYLFINTNTGKAEVWRHQHRWI